MFLRKFYLTLIKFLNYESTVDYLGLVTFDNLIITKTDVRDLDFFKKVYLCVFPNVYSEHYNLLNENTIRLLNFRKKFLPNFSYRLENYISYDYNSVFNGFCPEYFDFAQENMLEHFSVIKKLFKTENDTWAFYLMVSFLKKNFYHFFSLNFFNEHNEDNISKISFFFLKIFLNPKFNELAKINFKNIEKYQNWFNYIKILKYSNVSKIKPFSESLIESFDYSKSNELTEFKSRVQAILDDEFKPQVFVYSKACKAFFEKSTYSLIKTIFRVRIDLNKLWGVAIESSLIKKINSFYPYRYSDSSINKFINLSKIDNFIVFFLRKSKIFNKGRYSRNRQTYRTGFYWCLWLNIFVVYGLHFVFYRFTFTFGYLWLLLFIFFSSFIFSRALKYNLISLNSVISEIKDFFNFLKFIFENLFSNFIKLFLTFVTLFDKLVKNSEPYSSEDFNATFNSFTTTKVNQIIIDFYEKIEQELIFFTWSRHYSEIFEPTSTQYKMVHESYNIQEVFLTDIHEVSHRLYDENMLKYQKRIINKFRNLNN